ncbi:type I polyketide synthase [Tumebacillus permanentifrigoris]|uniref:Acyl transferase domain-containing protein n=1 Tax=Tumebacillus permanentifrigoris TaxID=378543 RepID=A0A316D6R9_9BACL|nr:type I polyketide synthase [Tumebacillus permanentifrigoris]PWK11298.1 acyl transferase domain-containing protein [Tumebacillus permanentifrigoris]
MSERLRQGYEPIAIVGIGCRFPGGVNSPESFWNLLREGVDAVTEVPADRWDTNRFYHPNRKKPGSANTRWGGFLDGVDKFDPEFFGISPREADLLDPQQRLMLEVSWEALEDAGFVPEQLAGSKTGVYVGCFTNDYQWMQVSEKNVDYLDTHSTSGFMMTLHSNRLSYVYDFQGPSMTVDTACSSSLVAVHLACQSLITGESNLALAGGINIMLKPELTIAESKGGFLSPDGRSKAFDSRANGYVRAEGCGMVVLKRLEEALADGDPIYAVIAGSACNQDGRSAGLTVPSGESQEALVREALDRAGIQSNQIQYMEAHGTGTPVGDPIEAKALGNVLSENRPDGEYCWVGSVKTNVGHMEGAAGVAGLIKAALCLQQAQIPPHLHLIEKNPNIDFEALQLRVPTTVQPWEGESGTRYAGVNSFGFGGTNAHVVLAEAPVVEKTVSPSTQQDQLIPLSARTPEALLDVAFSYREAVGEAGALEHVSLSDLACSTAQHRGHHPQRMAVVASTKEELLEALDAVISSEIHPRAIVGAMPVQPTKPRRLAFVYTGMGPQWWGMGRQLYEQEPVFRDTLDECDRVFQASSGWSLLEEMLKDEAASRMEETQIAQPANLFLQIGLTNWWRSMGIVPEAVVGHSAGEAAASYAAGIITLSEAVRVVYHRSRLQQAITGQGTMVAVGLSESLVREHMKGFEDRVSLAAINSPNGVTLAGEPEALEQVLAPLREADVFVRYLKVGMAFHSHYMNPMREEFLEHLEGMETKAGTIPYYSSVLGVQADIHKLGVDYWWRNLRDTVQFAEAVLNLIEDGYDAFVEIGPHPVLAASVRECLALKNRTADVLPSIRRAEDERPQLVSSLGALYTLGFEPNWPKLVEAGSFVRLPKYPWQREHHWQESAESRRYRLGEPDCHPLLAQRLSSARPVWESSIDVWRLPYLGDHRIRGAIVYPGAAYMEMGLAAARNLYGSRAVGLEIADVAFEKALFLNEETGDKLQIHFDPADGQFEVYSTGYESDPIWARHAKGTVRPQPAFAVRTIDLGAWRDQCSQMISKTDAYAHFQSLGLEYGPLFQGMEQLWKGQGVALAELRMPEPLEGEAGDYVFHPAMLDIALQMMAAVLPFDGEGRSALFMPVAITRAVLRMAPTARMWAFARLDEHTDSRVRGSITVVDEQGNVVLELTDCIAQSLQTDTSTTMMRPTRYAEFVWTPREREVQAQEANVSDASGTWLLFADETDVADQLASLLRDRGGRPVLVRPGTEFKRLDNGEYLVRVEHAEDYQLLLEDLYVDGQSVRDIAHLWSLNQTGGDAMQPQGCGSVLLLLQALAQVSAKQKTRLWLVTRGAQPVNGTETLDGIAQSALWGLGRVIGHQEHQDLWGGLLDLDSSTNESALDDAQNLLAEFLYEDGEDQIVFRAGQRLIGRLHDSGDLTVPLAPSFRPDGAYLITGAFGGLGLLIARWLIEQGARRLILIGREPLPERRDWDQHSVDSRIGQRIQAIRELECLGASVHVTGFDIADEAKLQDFLRDYHREGWPAIRGVFHSAGTAIPQMLAQMTLDDLYGVMRPKVLGAWNLHRAFADQPLDCFVLFSSMAAQIVSAGQGNYSAGNAYLDALARLRQAQGHSALSINWGSWADIGMANNLDLLDFFERRGIFPLQPEQGVQALGHLLAHTRPQVTVAALDWSTVLQSNYPNGEYPPMLADIVAQANEAGETDGNPGSTETVDFASLYRQTDDEKRQELLQEQLSGVVSQVLRVPRARLLMERSLQSYGLDSMMAIELKSRLEKTVGASIAIVDLIRGVSVTELAAALRPQVDEWAVLSDADVVEEDLMAELSELSPEELDALLAEIAATKEE